MFSKTAILLTILIAFTPFAFAEDMSIDWESKYKELQDSMDEPKSICPFTMIKDNSKCTTCHEVVRVGDGYDWGVKKKVWQNLDYGVKIVQRNGRDSLWYRLEEINDDRVFELLEYCREHGIDQLELEIFSPGGSVVKAWRIVALFKSYPDIHVTTRCDGFAASAGFVVLASGDTRIVSPYAMVMAHELWTLSWLKLDTPASSQDTAEDLKLWQDTINDWLAEVSGMTAEEIHEKIYKRDWWMTGKEFYKLGFADKLSWDGEHSK
jgi:ATP-dependent protease ClpP protease subunit